MTPDSRAANAIGRALLTPDARGERTPDQAASALLAGLQDLGFVSVDGEPARRASLAVLVAGAEPVEPVEPADKGTGARADEAIGELAVGLDRQGAGAVVAGPVESAAAGSLAYVRATDTAAGRVSTVDSAGTAVGRIAVVYALSAQAKGDAGHFGTGAGADAPFPDVTPPAKS